MSFPLAAPRYAKESPSAGRVGACVGGRGLEAKGIFDGGDLPDKHADLAVAVTTLGSQLCRWRRRWAWRRPRSKAIKALCGNIARGHCQRGAEAQRSGAAAQAVQDVKETDLVALRKKIAHLKTSPGWTPAMAQTLGVGSQASPEETSPATLDSHKPRVRLVKQADRVEIRFVRGKLDGVNIYCRKRARPPGASSTASATRRPSTAPRPAPRSARSPRVPHQAVFKNREIGLPVTS